LERLPDVIDGIVGEWGSGHGVVEAEGTIADAPSEEREFRDRGRLFLREPASGVVAMPGDDDPDDELGDPRGGLRPIERIGIAEEGDRAALEEVACEEDGGIRHDHHDVVVGMSTTEETELDSSIADVGDPLSAPRSRAPSTGDTVRHRQLSRTQHTKLAVVAGVMVDEAVRRGRARHSDGRTVSAG
jgi:hypothetical protein